MATNNSNRASRDLPDRDAWRRELVWLGIAGAVLFVVSAVLGVSSSVAESAATIAVILLAAAFAIAVTAVVFAVRRVRELDRTRDSLEHLSYEDSLTGLPNRRHLESAFAEATANAQATSSKLSVFFIDLQGFQQINDTYGHDVGDTLMVAVADRLVDALGPQDLILRYGGDEFVAFCTEVTNGAGAERQAKRFLHAIETPFERGEELLQVSACIGVAVAEDRPHDYHDILLDADLAAFVARSSGPGSQAVFDRSMRDALTPSRAEKRFRTAFEEGEFSVHYQPIVSLWTKRLVGVEAHLRWEAGEQAGLIRRESLVPALEDTGLIVPVGHWLLKEICGQTRHWAQEFPNRPPINLKVNLSPRILTQPDFADTLRQTLEESGADPDRLCLEVSEAALAQNTAQTWEALREAKTLGLTLALDRFGTGLSSISYLRSFNLDLIRIDKLFVSELGASREDETIVEHIIGMAKALGIVTVAEGVENEEQAEHLKSLNCDLAQGPYFARPVLPEIIDQLLAEGGGEHEWRPISNEALDAAEAAIAEAAAEAVAAKFEKPFPARAD